MRAMWRTQPLTSHTREGADAVAPFLLAAAGPAGDDQGGEEGGIAGNKVNGGDGGGAVSRR